MNGDFAPGDTIDFKFTTRQFSSGAPFTLAGSPAVAVYKGSSTTESTAGVTLTADFDARTGLNHVTITTASDGTFYSAGGQFDVVITAGTVNAVSVVGEVVGRFTLQGLSSRLPAALVSGRIDASIGAVASGVIAAASFAANALDAVWSTTTRLLTAGTNIVLAKGTGVTGFNDLDAPGVRGAVGLASANLDTQLAAISAFIDTEVAAIKSKTDLLTFTVSGQVDANIQYVNDVIVRGTGAAGNEWGPGP